MSPNLLVACIVVCSCTVDVKLGQLYQEPLQRSANKEALREQQRQWLAEREKDCVIYKWSVDCLTDMCTTRIAELGQITSGKTGQ